LFLGPRAGLVNLLGVRFAGTTALAALA
jgi:hypothetical protein